MGYIDLVLVMFPSNKRPYLFQAPGFSRIKTGDKLIVENADGKAEGYVLGVNSVQPDCEDFEFAVTACQATLPLKRVISKIEYRMMEYGGKEDE